MIFFIKINFFMNLLLFKNKKQSLKKDKKEYNLK